MEGLLDAGQLYGTLHSTWDKIRADVLSHAFLVCTLFFVARVSLPQPSPSTFDATCLVESPYFQLAKESGILLLAPALVVVAIVPYGVLVRAIGQSLMALLIMVFKPMGPNSFASDYVRSADLVTLAAMLDRSKWDEFNEPDLFRLLSELALRYSTKKGPELGMLNAESAKNKNAPLYLAYANSFLLGWVFVIALLPGSSPLWLQNQHRLLLEGLFLLAFFVCSWLRFREFMLMLPAEVIFFVANNIRNDEKLKPVLAAAESSLAEIEKRLNQLRQDWRGTSPSLLSYIDYTGSGFPSRHATKKLEPGRKTGLSRILAEGEAFGTDPDRNQRYDDEKWLKDYVAYVVYRLVRFGRSSIRTVALLPLVLVGFAPRALVVCPAPMVEPVKAA